jgi:hypothetical protein
MSFRGSEWRQFGSARARRSLDSVILDSDVKERVLNVCMYVCMYVYTKYLYFHESIYLCIHTYYITAFLLHTIW